MSKSTVDDDYPDFDWEDETDFEEREEDKNKSKQKQANRKLKIKHRMDDYLDSKRAKQNSKYLDSFDLDD